VTVSCPVTSKCTKGTTAPLEHDVAEDTDLTWNAPETLIAIGTQAGMVLIFNLLGLLIHEIVMDVPIIGIEWVGDMSGPLVMLKRVTPVSLESRPVMEMLDGNREEPSHKESCTVHISTLKHMVARYQILDAPDLYSGSDVSPTLTESLRKSSDVTTMSPLPSSVYSFARNP
jgi:hypothetical protein